MHKSKWKDAALRSEWELLHAIPCRIHAALATDEEHELAFK